MTGCLYSVGVGPGDPELMTLKTVRCIKRCPVIIIPAADKEKCRAYQIARQEITDIDEKECVCISLPMTKDKAVLEASHAAGTKAVADVLAAGKDAAFLTIGDPTVYATSMYIHQRIAAMGFHTEIISGVPSFCAASARLGISLGEKDEAIHIIPASYGIEESLCLPGTKILMKAGREMPRVAKTLERHPQQLYMVEDCGMETERVWTNATAVPDQAGYFAVTMPKQPGYYTLVIVKEKGNK